MIQGSFSKKFIIVSEFFKALQNDTDSITLKISIKNCKIGFVYI